MVNMNQKDVSFLSFQIKMTTKESIQSDTSPKAWTYCHVFLVMLSGLFLVATATTTILILYFVPENDYITIEMDLASSLTTLVYLSAGLIVFGLLQLVFLVVVLLHFHDTQKQRTFVSIGCVATALLSMGILILFAVQPQILMEKTLPEDDVIYEPINRSYGVAMEQYRQQTNQEVVESLRRLQTDEICCLHQYNDHGDDSCIINTGDGEILRSSRNCVEYFYDFYLNWRSNSEDIIQIMAIVFCAVLGLAVLVNIYLLLSTNTGSYTVQRREPGKYRKNLSSFTYVPFETDLPVRQGSKNETVKSDTVKTEVVSPDVFWITKNNVKEIAVFDPSICVMHDY